MNTKKENLLAEESELFQTSNGETRNSNLPIFENDVLTIKMRPVTDKLAVKRVIDNANGASTNWGAIETEDGRVISANSLVRRGAVKVVNDFTKPAAEDNMVALDGNDDAERFAAFKSIVAERDVKLKVSAIKFKNDRQYMWLTEVK